MKLVRSAWDIPDGPHYAVIVYEQLAVDDGYGGTTRENTASHYVTTSKEEWLAKIDSLAKTSPYSQPSSYVALEVKRKVKVTLKTTVDVD